MCLEEAWSAVPRSVGHLAARLCVPDLPREESAFTVVFLPDTQCYARRYPEVFDALETWLNDHAEELDVRAVVHLGDITDLNRDEEWAVAQRNLEPVLSRAALVLPPGNHDLGPLGSATDRSSLMPEHFPVDALRTNPAFVAAFEDEPFDVAWRVQGEHYTYLMVALEFAPRPEAVSWAHRLVRSTPHDFPVVATHASLDALGRRYDCEELEQPFCPKNYPVGAAGGLDGEALWSTLITTLPTARMVASGHVAEGFSRRIDRNDAGAEVLQFMADYQLRSGCDSRPGDGRGYILVAHVLERPDGVRWTFESYSPYDDALRPEHSFQFTFRPL